MKINILSSPNHSNKIRAKKNIKFIVIHYTGMQSERACIERLLNNKSQVSTHYLINRKGKITRMVDEKNTAWHAGKSKWKNFINLNDRSIGIELINKGHQFGYEIFSKKQILKLILLCRFLIKKYKIKKKKKKKKYSWSLRHCTFEKKRSRRKVSLALFVKKKNWVLAQCK